MKKNKLVETREKDLGELKKELLGAKKQLARLRLEKASGKLKNTRAGRNLKKDIAQLLTIIKEKV